MADLPEVGGSVAAGSVPSAQGERQLPAVGESVSAYELQVQSAQMKAIESLGPGGQAGLVKALQAGGEIGEAAQRTFVRRAQDNFDNDQEAGFQAALRAHPGTDPAVAEDVRRLMIAQPGYSFEHVLDNREQVRQETQMAGTDWRALQEQHPVLAKYLQDPERAGLALQESSTLTGLERLVGKGAPIFPGADGAEGEAGPFPGYVSTASKKYVPPPWAAATYDVLTKNLPLLVQKFDLMALRGGKLSDEDRARRDAYYRSFSNDLADAHSYEDKRTEEERAQQQAVREQAVDRLTRESTSSKDYAGPTPPDASIGTNIARRLEYGVLKTVETAPLVAGAAAGGLGGEGGIFFANTLMSVPDLYERAYKETGSQGKSVGIAFLSAPVLGKLLSAGPTSAMFSAGDKIAQEGLYRAILRDATQTGLRKGIGLSFLGARKFGYDFLTAKAVMAAQSAAGEASGQVARLAAGKETDGGAVWRAADNGWHDANDLWLLIGMGTAKHLADAHGRMVAAQAETNRLSEIVSTLANSKAAKSGSPEFDQMIHEVAARGDSSFHFDLTHFEELAKVHNLDPRDIMSQVLGDDGTAYDKAMASTKEITIPIEKLKKLAADPRFTDYVRMAGRPTEATINGFAAAKTHEMFAAAHKEMQGRADGALTSEEKSIFEAEKARHLDDMPEEEAAKRAKDVLSALAGYQKILPGDSLHQLYQDLYTMAHPGVEGPQLVDQKLAREFMALPDDTTRARHAFYDSNTGLENEAGFARHQPAEGEEYVHLSFEGLKWFQDTLKDHGKGDLLYREMARVLHGLSPNVAKVGPDFGLILKKGEAGDFIRKANEALPEHLKAFKITGDSGHTWEEAEANHRDAKDKAVADGDRSAAGQQPKGWSGKTDPAKLALSERQVEQPTSPDLEAAADPTTAYRVKRSGLLNKRGDALVAQPGDHLLHLDADGVGTTNWVHRRLADHAIQEIGRLYRELGGDESVRGSHFSGDEFGGRHRSPEVLKRFAEELKSEAERLILRHTDLATGKTYEQKGIGFSYGIGSDKESAEAGLAADKLKRAKAGERDASGVRGADAVIARRRITVRDATPGELAAAKRHADADAVRRGGDLGAGDVGGGERQAPALRPDEAAVVQADLRRATQDSRIFDVSVKDLISDPQEKEKYEKIIGSAQDEARAKLDLALRSSTRQFIPQTRAKFLGEADNTIRQDPGQRARHWFETKELWGDDTRQFHLLHPETGEPLRLLARDVEQRFGPGAVEALRSKQAKLLTSDSAKAGDIDFLANALGYESPQGLSGSAGDQLVRDLIQSKAEGGWKQEWADKKLKEALRPDLLDNPQALMARALDAVHNPKTAMKMQRDLQALATQLDADHQMKAAMSPELRIRLADQHLDNSALRDVHPDAFHRASARAMERAQLAIAAGRHADAFNEIDNALTNHYLYTQARDRQIGMDKKYAELLDRATGDYWRRQLGKADPLYQKLHDSLLGALGIGEQQQGSDKVLDAFLDKVKLNSQEVNSAANDLWDVNVLRGVLTGEKSWGDLLPGEANQVYDAIKNIQHMAQAQNAALDALRGLQVNEARQDIIDHISRPDPAYPLMQDKNMADLGGRASRMWRKVTLGITAESLEAPRVMLKDLGPAGEKIWNGFLDARRHEYDLLHTLYEPWKELQKIWEKDPDYRKPLEGLQAYLGKEGLRGELTKQTLINAMRWMGSESGRKKLLTGLNITPEAVAEAASKYLTKEEILQVQKEYDYFEQYHRPILEKESLRRYGLPLEMVKPMEFTIVTPGGENITLKGGYFPVNWDRREGAGQQPISSQPDVNRGGGTDMPVVPNGSFKERTRFVGTPDLNWDNIPGHLLADIHSVAYGEFVQQSNRVLLDQNVLHAISENYGPEFAKQPRAWLDAVAGGGRDHVVEAMAGMNREQRIGRSSLVTAALALRIPTAVAHITTPFQTAMLRHGAAMTMEHLVPAFSRVLQGYATQMTTGINPVREQALRDSKVLQSRADTLSEDMYRWYGVNADGTAGFRHGMDKWMAKVQEVGFWHQRALDALMGTTIFEAEKSYGLANGLSREEAIAKADEAVLGALPSYDPKELPPLMREKRSSLVASSILVFHTLNSKLYEQVIEQKHGVDRAWDRASGLPGKASAATKYAMFTAHALAAMTFYGVVGEYILGRGKEKDEHWGDWLKRKEMAAPFRLLPFGSTLAEPVVDTMVRGRKSGDISLRVPQMSPAINTLKVIQEAFDHRKSGEDKLKSALDAALMLSGNPANAVTNPMQYGYHLGAGTEHPRGALDILSGLVYGKKYGRAARYQTSNPLTDIETQITGKKAH